MTVKLIALNLDDNTDFAEEGISAFDAETALEKASGSDAEIVTVSAQCYRALQHELVNIDKRRQIRYTVTSDGAEIRDAERGNVLYNRYILEDEARKVKEALKDGCHGRGLCERKSLYRKKLLRKDSAR